MTIRQYADNFKQTLGTILSIYETANSAPSGTDKTVFVTNVLNTLPSSVLDSFPPGFQDKTAIANFVLALGAVLEPVFPGA